MERNVTDDGFPVWFDGKSVNEALFCEEYLKFHKLIFTNGVFFTLDGRITDELPLRKEIYEDLKNYAGSNLPRKISNILEILKLEAQKEDFLPDSCCKWYVEIGWNVYRE